MVYNVAQVSYRQAVTPDHLLGRMNASVRFLVWGVMPLGALAGGGLGTVLGIRTTLLLSAAGASLSGFWVLASPLRTTRDISDLRQDWASRPEPCAGATSPDMAEAEYLRSTRSVGREQVPQAYPVTRRLPARTPLGHG